MASAPGPVVPSPPAPAHIDPNHVQGDILVGLPKKTQTFYFFQIDTARVQKFRTQFAALVPLITTTAQVQNDLKDIARNRQVAAEKGVAAPLLTLAGVNIVFSNKGLKQLGIKEDIGDTSFDEGMLADAKALGDQGTTSASGTFTPDWIPAFKHDIHGCILVTGDCHATVAKKLEEVEAIFEVRGHDASIHEVHRIVGDVRPGNEEGHEHFGFLDGISQPAVAGVDLHPNPGQETVRQGIILLGREGDKPNVPGVTVRPSWALDGSFLAFRYLFQLVPEFDSFLTHNPIPGLPPAQGSELLGARLVGRWKSGAPVDLAPVTDDPKLGKDPQRNNNFRYNFPDDAKTQDRCPFGAHVRKTNPRADLEDLTATSTPVKGPIPTEPQRIIRRGIQFGPEVTPAEAAAAKTSHGRGLAFVAYQSNIVNGFDFIQKNWANNIGFPIDKPVPQPGFDPIIGQDANPAGRTILGTRPKDQSFSLKLPAQWVVPRGGEYFFSPSIPALKGTFALAKPEPLIQNGH